MADQKPLPALPTCSLTVEAKAHRARLIKHFLSDIHETEVESRRDTWLHAFEEALDDLAQQSTRGDWLTSIRRAKESRRSRKSAMEQSEEKKEQSKSEKPLPPQPEAPLELLWRLAARPALPSDDYEIGHLVLCTASHNETKPLSAEDSGFDVIPDNVGCTFSSGTFALQEAGPHEEDGTVIFGLSDELSANDNLRLVGGTFILKGVNSATQHRLLRKVLRLSIYVHLSLILEQSVLSDSGIQLKFSRPKLSSASQSSPMRPIPGDKMSENGGTNEEPKVRPHRNSVVPSSFTNFFFRRKFTRSHTITPSTGRIGSSLDLTATIPPSASVDVNPRRSIEGAVNGLRLRRLSFLADRRVSIKKSTSYPLHVKTEPELEHQPFFIAVKRIEESRGALSTSPGVILSIPKLITDLAEKEKAKASQDGPIKRRLKGDERVALTSILGWDGKDAEGNGMSGIIGFVRHQGISVLHSSHVPPSSCGPSNKPSQTTPPSTSTQSPAHSKDIDAQDPTSSSSALVTSSDLVSTTNLPQYGLLPCGKPHWVTYRYYSSSDKEDSLFGHWVQDVALNRKLRCNRPDCTSLQGQHEQRLIHDGVRVVIRVADVSEKNGKEKEADGAEASNEKIPHQSNENDLFLWESCAVCNAKSSQKKMSDATYLSSFAKYLELLMYSPSMCNLTSLCEHTIPATGPSASLPWSRFNIVRHFFTASADISIALSPIEDIFELRVPRLQITRSLDKATPPPTSIEPSEQHQQLEDPQKKVLRKEIKRWWEGVSDHMDKIEMVLSADEPTQKTLPRLPSMDSAYEVFNAISASEAIETPRPGYINNFLLQPHTTPNTPSNGLVTPQQGSYFSVQPISSTGNSTLKVPPDLSDEADTPERLLAALRHNFQKVEQSLYTQLARTPEGSLNDVRRAFFATGRGSRNRLKAWQKKHLGTAKSNLVGDLNADEPSWWDKRCHAVPGGNLVVREDDWGSIIAHTLSTVDYQLELANLSMVRSSSGPHPPPPPSPVPQSGTTSLLSVASGYRLFTASAKSQPDPDQEDVVWNEPESYSAVISRKENVRDGTPLLSIRDVLRTKNASDPSNRPASTTSSRLSGHSGSNASHTSGPTSVKTKPDIGLTMQAADGKNVIETKESASEVLLQGLGHSTSPTVIISSRPASIISAHGSASLENITTDISTLETGADRMSSGDSKGSQNTIKQDEVDKTEKSTTEDLRSGRTSQPPPPLPPKDDPKPNTPGHGHVPSTLTAPSAWNTNKDLPVHQVSSSHSSSGFASTLASGISSAMRYVLKGDPHTRSTTPSGSTVKKQHHVLLADIATFDERPHIKYDWTIGKRIKFSCTAYYAKQFDVLRKRCGIQDVFVKSLSKSTDWMTEGGKSKANFWKTTDDRFVIKTLVNAWNVADLQVLMDFAPSYFRYMDATASKPTVLCKVLGFYTIEIKNLETGAVQSKADLLVMENLFFNQKINKTFDLKGIQGRKVKSHGDTTKTLFDGEWIEGQQRTLTLVRPHSKLILREAVRSDAEFLAKSNIMDYSLLLGVDEQKKEIACGLVDTIGSYNFGKTIEYKAKNGLQSGKEVTVMPPAEYQERFVNALEGYFIACPDKWSKPLDESKIISDPDLLPSVL